MAELKEFKIKTDSFKLSELTVPGYNPRIPIEDNPKKYEALYNSIVKLGYLEPIIVNIKDKTNIIVGGSQRYKIMCDMAADAGRQLSQVTVDVVVVDMEPMIERTANVTLNATGSDWQTLKLEEDVRIINEYDEELAKLTGLGEDAIEDLTTPVDDEPKEVTKDFKISLRLPIEYENLYEFYCATKGEDDFKKQVMRILSGESK